MVESPPLDASLRRSSYLFRKACKRDWAAAAEMPSARATSVRSGGVTAASMEMSSCCTRGSYSGATIGERGRWNDGGPNALCGKMSGPENAQMSDMLVKGEQH